MAQKLFQPNEALDKPWPLGNKQNCVNHCKSKNSAGFEWLRNYTNQLGRCKVHGHWKDAKLCKSLKKKRWELRGGSQVITTNIGAGASMAIRK